MSIPSVQLDLNKPVHEVPKLSLHDFQKYFLFILCLITFCTCPVLAVAAQSGLSENTTHLETQPSYIYVEEQAWMVINKRHFIDYITDFESIVAVPKHDITTLDRIKGYFTEKQPVTSEQDIAKNGWSIAPLFGNYNISPLVDDLSIGVLLKFRF